MNQLSKRNVFKGLRDGPSLQGIVKRTRVDFGDYKGEPSWLR